MGYHHTRSTCLLMLLSAALGHASAWTAKAERYRAGDWPQFRRDQQMTGRSTLKGDIAKPEVEWRHFIGQRETLLAVQFGDAGSSRLTLPNADRETDQYEAIRARWGFGKPSYDLDGDGRLTTVEQSQFHKIGKFLPDWPGLQKLEFESGFLKPSESWSPAVPYYGRLLVRKGGKWHPEWQTPAIPYLFFANPVIGDFDNDGCLEVAVVPHDNLWVFDVAAGKVKYKTRFKPDGASSGRSYGYLGAHDLDGDGRHEFVMIPTFECHIDVLGWKKKELQARWHRVIESGINRKKTVLNVPAGPVRDIDGDDRFEIVVSTFNANGDGRWHVEAMDALTGQIKLDLPELYLSGLEDLDGDGIAEMLCSRPVGMLVPDVTEISVLSVRDGKAVTGWQNEGQSFVTHRDTQRPLHENVSTPYACGLAVRTGVLETGSLPVFLTQRSVDRLRNVMELSAWQVGSDGSVEKVGQLQGSYLEALAIRARAGKKGGLLIRTRHGDRAPSILEGEAAVAVPLLSRRIGGDVGPAVVGRLKPGALVSVVVQKPGLSVAAIDITSDQESRTKTRWTVPGRGTFPADIRHDGQTLAGSPVPGFGGVVLADVFGSGELATVVAGVGNKGTLQVRAIAADGSEIWQHGFPHVPGEERAFVVIHAGHLTDKRRADVVVTVQPGHLHSEMTYALDGRTGKEVWRRSEGGMAGGTRRACGGNWFVLDDWDGDGLDDILCLFPDVIYVMQGSTGAILLDRWTPQVFGAQSLYASPVMADFLGNGRKQILYAGCTARLAMLDRQATVLWSVLPPPQAINIFPSIPPGVGDSDGDGSLELFSLAHRVRPESRDQMLVCYQAADGRVRWQLPLPGSAYGPNGQLYAGCPSVPCTGDIDGDGRDECLFAVDETLYAVGADGEGSSGQIEWSMTLPARLSPPVIADTNGSGQARIVVVCADGHVYCISPSR